MAAGVIAVAISVLLGLILLVLGLCGETAFPAWAIAFLFLSFLNGVVIVMLAIVGEQVARLLKQTSGIECYHVREIVQKKD